MKDRESFTLYLWLVFCLFICIESWRLGLGSLGTPGPGFIPFGAALGTGLIALALLLVRKGKSLSGHTPPSFQRMRFKKILYMVCAIFIYPLLLNGLGFFLCTLFFIGFSLKVIEPQKWRIVLGVGIGAAVASYVVFDVLLKIQLPKGTWLFFLR